MKRSKSGRTNTMRTLYVREPSFAFDENAWELAYDGFGDVDEFPKPFVISGKRSVHYAGGHTGKSWFIEERRPDTGEEIEEPRRLKAKRGSKKNHAQKPRRKPSTRQRIQAESLIEKEESVNRAVERIDFVIDALTIAKARLEKLYSQRQSLEFRKSTDESISEIRRLQVLISDQDDLIASLYEGLSMARIACRSSHDILIAYAKRVGAVKKSSKASKIDQVRLYIQKNT